MGLCWHDFIHHPERAGLTCSECGIQWTSGGEYNVPAYSTDLRAAFDVVERLRGEGWLFEAGNFEGGDWLVAFSRSATVGREEAGAECEADTLPEAIARAALATREDG
jgi:hypothetical protein